MSGVGKAIGKVFKAVGSFVKKIAAPVLAAAAIVFTGGAALGLAPLTMGFGGAVTGALSAIGAPTTGVLGGVLTGAVTQAGYGAALGGVASSLTGGSFTEGAATGALAGAVTGGVTGGLGAASAPSATMASRGLSPASGMPPTTAAPLPRPTSGVSTPVQEGLASAGNASIGGASNGPGGLLRGITQSPAFGSTLAGIGQGLLTGMAQKEQLEQEQEDQERITASYDVDMPERRGVTADFGPRRYRYNHKTRRIDYS